MKTLTVALGLFGASLVCAAIASGDPLAPAVEGKQKKKDPNQLVFVTGSHIPQRVQVKAIGTNTASPVRVYTRAELDRSGKFTTQGQLAQDPSVTIIGNGDH